MDRGRPASRRGTRANRMDDVLIQKKAASTALSSGSNSRHPAVRTGHATVADLHGVDRFGERGARAAHNDPQAGWLEALAMDNLAERTAFIDGLLRELARTDPLKAVELAAALPNGSFQKDAYAAACAGWVAVDPDGASKWATTHLQGPLAADAFSAITREGAANFFKLVASSRHPIDLMLQ